MRLPPQNQFVHGGGAFTERWAQTQIRDGARIIGDVVPVIPDTMKAEVDANPEPGAWGKAAYPRISETRNQEEPRGSVPRRV